MLQIYVSNKGFVDWPSLVKRDFSLFALPLGKINGRGRFLLHPHQNVPLLSGNFFLCFPELHPILIINQSCFSDVVKPRRYINKGNINRLLFMRLLLVSLRLAYSVRVLVHLDTSLIPSLYYTTARPALHTLKPGAFP